jgi:hypothetical protein
MLINQGEYTRDLIINHLMMQHCATRIHITEYIQPVPEIKAFCNADNYEGCS